MKKFGFTLAEVLITLGIVGVVSALVLPTFTTKMQTAKVGPRLAKAVAAFEQANIAVLGEAQADALSGAIVEGRNALIFAQHYFGRVLPTHMKGSYDSTNTRYISADGAAYCIVQVRKNATEAPKCDRVSFNIFHEELPHQNPVTLNGMSAIMIDIDGDNGPNAIGRDLFFFQMMDDGSLLPWGGSWESNANRWNTGTNCPKDGTATRLALCAGHVFENGLKVEYK